MPPTWVLDSLRSGVVIPAHPLALTLDGAYDARAQRALSRYYHAAGAGGMAVGVHTTQFEIREPRYNLLQPVLELAAETVKTLDARAGRQTILVAGVCGPTRRAIDEAKLARSLGYHAGLLSLASMQAADDDQLIEHCLAVAAELPLFGFYLQPTVGGRNLSVSFWRRFAQIKNSIGIKIAPFDRYKTLDVVRAVAEAGREAEVVLYTGNDDAIVVDLLSEYRMNVDDRVACIGIAGGLLGHWACWTEKAVELLDTCKRARETGRLSSQLLTLATEVTDCNAALFDASNDFAGCIAGIQYVLHRQGILSSARCLDATAKLSPGQQGEIDRVRKAYPHLNDDDFVAQHLGEWLS
jgi:dihydrodipicolinate synthase/N-acetylneuraminate lyase